MNKKAIIFGIKGYNLTKLEKIFFKSAKPWGIILFSRNIKNIYQLKSLINEIKKIFSNKNYPILIDQEGGKVSRLNKIINLSFFSQDFFGKLYKKDKKLFYKVYKIYVNNVCDIFKKVGINMNTVPVLDVARNKTHKIIGSRAFSRNPHIISKLGNLCVNLHKKNKIATISKHIPGHGLAKCDSHYQTPIINSNRKKLIKYDFKTTATHSKIIINKVIRNHIKFRGILISDDISMKSLKYDLEENAIRALNAGCNLVLHCNGKMSEMIKLSKVIPNIDKFTLKKTSHLFKFLG